MGSTIQSPSSRSLPLHMDAPAVVPPHHHHHMPWAALQTTDYCESYTMLTIIMKVLHKVVSVLRTYNDMLDREPGEHLSEGHAYSPSDSPSFTHGHSKSPSCLHNRLAVDKQLGQNVNQTTKHVNHKLLLRTTRNHITTNTRCGVIHTRTHVRMYTHIPLYSSLL